MIFDAVIASRMYGAVIASIMCDAAIGSRMYGAVIASKLYGVVIISDMFGAVTEPSMYGAVKALIMFCDVTIQYSTVCKCFETLCCTVLYSTVHNIWSCDSTNDIWCCDSTDIVVYSNTLMYNKIYCILQYSTAQLCGTICFC